MNDEAHLQTSDGRRRLGVILQRIQMFVNTMWQGRNEMLHRRDKEDEAKFVSIEAAEIRHYFSQPHLLPVSNQHYCKGSVLQILRSSPANRRQWLRRVRRARADLINNQLRQARITSFFTHRNNDATSNDTGTDTLTAKDEDSRKFTERRIQASDTKNPVGKPQQQTRIHHYFPGQPPENPNTGRTVTTKSLASK